MPRRTHKPAPEDAQEDIRRRFNLYLPPSMHAFLEAEAKRLSEKNGRTISGPDVVRALVTSYYEKRGLGLLIDPDD